jgi:hypothetical protein
VAPLSCLEVGLTAYGEGLLQDDHAPAAP